MRTAAITLLLACLALPVMGANPVATFSGMSLVPRINDASVYASYTGDDNTNSVCSIQFRVNGSGSAYRNGLACWTDNQTKTYKGSLVSLSPNTTYEVIVTVTDADGVPATSSITNTMTTLSEVPQVASIGGLTSNTTNSPNFTINTSGSAGALIQYGPSSGRRWFVVSTLNDSRGVIANGDYLLFQGLDFIGGTNNALKVTGGHHKLWFRYCTFTSYGYPAVSTGTPSTFPDQDDNAALCIGDHNTGGCYEIIIEHCVFALPTGGANDWSGGHPLGPHAICIASGAGQFIIRYNVVIGGTGHYFNDAIGGYQNEAANGMVGKDSAIYGNIVAGAHDDGIECDGGNQNVLIYGNQLTNCHTAISTAACLIGPSYIFRNLAYAFNTDAGAGNAGVFLKRGISSGAANYGAQWAFNNTEDDFSIGNGIDNSGGGSVVEARVRNNIMKSTGTSIKDLTASWTSTYDYDLVSPGFGTLPSGSESHGTVGTATYVAGGYYLDPASLGYHTGTPIANFLDDASGNAISNPNRGAFDSRFSAIQLGPIDPAINSGPGSQSVTVGQTATFTVSAIGNSALHYQWTFNGSNVGTDSDTYARTNCQLSDNGGTVQVTVSDSAGSMLSTTATLSVTSSGGGGGPGTVTGFNWTGGTSTTGTGTR